MTKITNWKRIVVVFFVALVVSVGVDWFWEWSFPNSSPRWDTAVVTAMILTYIVIAWGRRRKKDNHLK